MINVIVLLSCFHYGMMEPPVNTYLPTAKNVPVFSKTYAPPTHNVSFNFGFSPRKIKDKTFMDTSPMGYGDSNYYSNESSRRFKEPIKEFDNNPVMTQLIYKNIQNIDNNFNQIKKEVSLSSPSLNTDNKSVPRSSQQDIVHNTYSDKDYLNYQKNVSPQLEENKFARKFVNQNHSFRESNSLKHEEILEKDSFKGYSPSVNNLEADMPKHAGSSYEFSYEVISPETGVDQGHRESFDGESAEGVYHNLLPDGRLLTVEYWADDSGFKPRISYKILDPSHNRNGEGPY